MRGLLPVLGLSVPGLPLGVSPWNLDWAAWYRRFYLYHPPLRRHCCAGQIRRSNQFPPPNDPGFWAYVQYFLVAASISVIVSAYALPGGERREAR